jgi:hypothetical protein
MYPHGRGRPRVGTATKRVDFTCLPLPAAVVYWGSVTGTNVGGGAVEGVTSSSIGALEPA